MLIEWELLYRSVLSGGMVDVPGVISSAWSMLEIWWITSNLEVRFHRWSFDQWDALWSDPPWGLWHWSHMLLDWVWNHWYRRSCGVIKPGEQYTECYLWNEASNSPQCICFLRSLLRMSVEDSLKWFTDNLYIGYEVFNAMDELIDCFIIELLYLNPLVSRCTL